MRLHKRALSLVTILSLSAFVGVLEPPQVAHASTVSCNPTISSVIATSNVWNKSKTFTITGPGHEEAGYVVPVQNRASWVGKGFDQLNAEAAAAAAAIRPPVSTTPSPLPTPTGNAAAIASQVATGASAGWIVDTAVGGSNTPTRGQGSGTQGSPTGTSGLTGSQAGLTGVPLSIPGINATGTAGPGITATPSIPGINATGTAGTFTMPTSVTSQTQIQQIQAVLNSIDTRPAPGTGATVLHAQLAQGISPFITAPSDYTTPHDSASPLQASDTVTISPNVYIRPDLYINPTNSSSRTTPLTAPSSTPAPYVDGRVLGINSASSFQSTETITGGSGQSVDVTPEMSYQGNGIWTDPAGNRMQITINAGQTPNRSATFEPCANSNVQGPIGGLSATYSDNQVDVVGGYNINNGQQFALQALVSINIVGRPSSSGSAGSSGATISTDYLAATSVCTGSGTSIFNLKITPPYSAASSYEFFTDRGTGESNITGFSRVNALSDPSKPAGYGWDTQPANPGQTFKWQVWGISSTGNTMFKSNIVTITAKSCPQPAAAAAPTTTTPTVSTARGGSSSSTSLPAVTATAQKPSVFTVDATTTCSQDKSTIQIDLKWGSSSPIKNYILTDVTNPAWSTPLLQSADQSFGFTVASGKSNTRYYRLSALGANSANQYSGLFTLASRGNGTVEPGDKITSDAFGIVMPDCSASPVPAAATSAVTAGPAPEAFTVSASATCVDKKPVVMLTWKPSTNAATFATLQFTPTATVYSVDLPATKSSQSFEMLAPKGFEEAYTVLALNSDGISTAGVSETDATATTVKLTTPDCTPTPAPFTGTIAVSCDKGLIAAKATWKPAQDADRYNIYDTSVAGSRTLLASVPVSHPFLDLSTLTPGRADIQFSVEAINDNGHSLADVPAKTADPIVLPDCTLPPPPAVTVTPPVATDATTIVPVSAKTPVSVTIAPTITDLDNNLKGTGATMTIIEQPKLGTAVISADNQIKFTPRQDVTGVDTLTYKVCDTTGLCDTAKQTIDLGVAPSNAADAKIVSDAKIAAEKARTDTATTQAPIETITLSIQAVCAGQQPQNILTWNSAGNNKYSIVRDSDQPVTRDVTNYIDSNFSNGSTHSYVVTSGTIKSNAVGATAKDCAVTTTSNQAPATGANVSSTPINNSSQASPTTPTTTPALPNTPVVSPTTSNQNFSNGVPVATSNTPAPAATPVPAVTPTPAQIPTQPTTLLEKIGLAISNGFSAVGNAVSNAWNFFTGK